MAIDKRFIGRTYGPFRYTAGLEKMREFATAVAGDPPSSSFGEGPPPSVHPWLVDEDAARASPYGSVIGFPTFAVTFAMTPFFKAITDPALEVNLVMLVHGEQDFELFEVIRPGDVLTTHGTITDIYEKAGKSFLVTVTESRNQHGRLVVRGTWTAVVR